MHRAEPISRESGTFKLISINKLNRILITTWWPTTIEFVEFITKKCHRKFKMGRESNEMIRLTVVFTALMMATRASSVSSELFQLFVDSISCRFRRRIHSCCALCSWCKLLQVSKISLKQKSKKSNGENKHANCNRIICSQKCWMRQTIKATHKWCIDKRCQRQKNENTRNDGKIWRPETISMCK